MKTWGETKAEATKKGKRFVVIPTHNGWSVEDVEKDKTKAVFYDEAAKELAEDFCKQINKTVK